MPGYSTPPTAVALGLLTAAQWNATIRDSLEFLNRPPSCHAYLPGNVNVATTAWAAMALTAEYWDNDAMHDNAVNPSRITIKTPGYYRIVAGLCWNNNATGFRKIGIRANGNFDGAGSAAPALPAGFHHPLSCTADMALVVGNYVELMAYQTSGGLLTALSGVEGGAFLSVHRIAGL